jgi:hypothetical protein
VSVKQLFIIGAGASNGAKHVNEQMKPPLTTELANIFNYDCIQLTHSPDGKPIKIWFKDLLERINPKKNDIEELFTVLFILKFLIKIRNRNYPDKEKIPEILAMLDFDQKKILNTEADQYKEIERYKKILNYFLENPKAFFLLGPATIEDVYSVCLRDYIYNSITNNFCEYHSLLFSNLTDDDAVVSFNYDLICDFTLYRIGKLTQSSFDGLGFRHVIIFNNENSVKERGVKFLHIHGAFNWWFGSIQRNYDNINYILDSQVCPFTGPRNSPYPIILPIKHKQIIYESISIYKRHVDMFLKLIEESTIIYLVGKTFENSDYELFALIQERSKKLPKELYIIDKILDDPIRKDDFIKNHEKLFNARFVKGWIDLAQYSELNKNNKSIH